MCGHNKALCKKEKIVKRKASENETAIERSQKKINDVTQDDQAAEMESPVDAQAQNMMVSDIVTTQVETFDVIMSDGVVSDSKKNSKQIEAKKTEKKLKTKTECNLFSFSLYLHLCKFHVYKHLCKFIT